MIETKKFDMAINEYKNYEIKTSKLESGMTIKTCKTEKLTSMVNIIVPAIPWNEQGHSHALEHMVFLGSNEYPKKGYLSLTS